VHDWLYRHTGRFGALDGNYIARLERGAVRRPGRDYRAGFRAMLGATDDAELGFVVPGRSHSPLRAPQSADLDPARVMPVDDEAPATDDYLGELRCTISHLVALDGVHGGGEIAPIALRSFRRAQRILSEGRYVPAIERDLEAVTAELGELSGWLLFDAEQQDQARAVNAEALNLAHIAGDASMNGSSCRIRHSPARIPAATVRRSASPSAWPTAMCYPAACGRCSTCVRLGRSPRSATRLPRCAPSTGHGRRSPTAPRTATRCGPGGSMSGSSPGTRG
jgi:hypothetical protein